MIGSVIAHAVERHVTDKALNSREGEDTITSVRNSVEGFLSGVHTWELVLVGVLLVIGIIVWNLTGKGQGSHAGREEVRRSYRRELAKQMARQDAEQIKLGQKQRRKWMQW